MAGHCPVLDMMNVQVLLSHSFSHQILRRRVSLCVSIFLDDLEFKGIHRFLLFGRWNCF